MAEINASKTHRPYDAIVVGARIAGAATAMLLARRGQRVLMVDRRRPGGDTLSTHALMRAGVLQLERWGLLDRIRESDAPAILRATFHYGSRVEAIDLEPSAGVPALYAPRRTVLDTILVEAAARAGVDVRFGVTVRELLEDDSGRVAGIAGRTRSGRPLLATARIVIGADGRRSLIARRVGALEERSGTAASCLIYSYWSGQIAEGYEFFYRPGVSAGLIPTNAGETCVWVGAPAARFAAELHSDLERSFRRLLVDAAPEAAARLAEGGRRTSRTFAFPGMAGFMRRPYGAGWALVGDASHFKDPLSAHGMTDALRDAELLANAVSATAAGVSEEAALEAYAATRDRLSIALHEATDELAAYRWDIVRARALLRAMSKTMKDEVDEILSLACKGTRSAA